MTTSIPSSWQNKIWTIRSAEPAPAAAVLRKTNGSNDFRLVPVRRNGTILAYRVEFQSGAMTAAWKNCYLVPRGLAKPARPNGLPLPPYAPSTVVQYQTVVGDVLNQVKSDAAHFNTERLEGDITVNGRREAVTLYRVEDAIQDSNGKLSDLLVIDLQSDVIQPLQPREDGIAHGHPR